jgi:A/G-specific adenine glycosylase
VLLQRRGPQGVWSGLWSLPEAADHAQAWRIAQSHARLDDAVPLTSFMHVFTHFRLRIEPLLFAGAQPRGGIAEDAESRWCDARELAAIGLPAPVRSLLLQTLAMTAPTASSHPPTITRAFA